MSKIISIFGEMSLRNRLVIASVVCLLIPSILTLILTNEQIKIEQIEKSVAQTESTLHSLDKNITKQLDQLLYISNYVQFNNELHSILKNNINRHDEYGSTPESNALDHIRVKTNLEGITNLLAPSYIAIVLDNGFVYSNHSINYQNLMNKAWFQKQLATTNLETKWVGSHSNYSETDKERNPYLISIVRNVRLTHEENASAIISMSEEELSSLFEQTTFKGQQFMLVNSDGVIISHQNKDFIQKPFPNPNHLKDNKYSIEELDQQKYLLVDYPLSYSNWILVSMIPYESAIGDVSTITNTRFLWQLSFFAIFLIILILIVNELTKPISRLSYVMGEVENGNFNIRSEIRGKGDVKQLGTSLDMMIDKVEEMIKRIKKEEDSKHKAELEMLLAQINPHFLFNILNSIRLKIFLKGDKETANLIQSLAHLLRMTINRNNEFIPLEKEIETIEHYVKLMNFRRQGDIEIVKHIEKDLLDEDVPRFILQPLVENAIIHGFDANKGTISIHVLEANDFITIRIQDDGKGIPPVQLQELKKGLSVANPTNKIDRNKSSFTGIGITNVYQRMLLIYGERFQMNIDSQHLEGTTITLYIPKL
ncbi:sensor histidine kinase [Oceanobacillus longus]|uniref:histidine kinase n=1 Tax=Oceanobacillus longus TaxID=930120 RepID=A0ABV8GYP9_9BACI